MDSDLKGAGPEIFGDPSGDIGDKGTEEVGGTSALASYSCKLSCQHKNVQTQKNMIQESACSLFAA